MTSQQPMSIEEARPLLNLAKWYHHYEIIPGLFTTGHCQVQPREAFDVLGVPTDLRGLRALDIGAWDGPYAFELERRGAQVVALDIQDPNQTGFNTAKKILRSSVEYVRGSVYELTTKLTGQFDLVSYLGVFYHLKHPIASFEQIASVTKPYGKMVFEGEIFSDYAETLKSVSWKNRRLLRKISSSDVPVTLCYPGFYKGQSNWFIPNQACLRGWMEASGFNIEHMSLSGSHQHPKHRKLPWRLFVKPSHTRCYGMAIKTTGNPVEEHPIL